MLDGPEIFRLPRKLVTAKGAFVHGLILYIPAVCVWVGRCLQHLHLNFVLARVGVEF